jgi:hypothetical protein
MINLPLICPDRETAIKQQSHGKETYYHFLENRKKEDCGVISPLRTGFKSIEAWTLSGVRLSSYREKQIRHIQRHTKTWLPRGSSASNAEGVCAILSFFSNAFFLGSFVFLHATVKNYVPNRKQK